MRSIQKKIQFKFKCISNITTDQLLESTYVDMISCITKSLLHTNKIEFNLTLLGITLEQREKLMSQKKQYIDAKLKLEDQLLKLKEEREELKERGNKHDDKIMRENAKLQVIKTKFFIIKYWRERNNTIKLL